MACRAGWPSACAPLSHGRAFDQEILIAFSTDPEQPISAYSTVEARFRAEGDRLRLIFWHAPYPAAPPPSEIRVKRKGQRLAARLTVPPAAFVMYEAIAAVRSLSASQRAEALGLEEASVIA